MSDRNGQCLCGAVTFSARDVVSGLGVCHCKMCQRWGGVFFAGVSVGADRITWSGNAHIRVGQSSDWAERAWCDGCGSPLWYRVTAEGPNHGDYEVPLGLFDDASGLKLDREIFADRAVPALNLSGTHERISEAETLARYGHTVQGA
ncbi:GFA family protein [Puniceibacterium sp. IMCC21224]|uniref:GFA family protein n=1 Tax=Puniceibacterium sp. IMCC21224 TaxID=1618204 RepID=UPI00064D83C8|nr:GFA family protein [Puniceibacterium sp. IMCC21224]KMK66403.1 hypothetical protein IMCC21224_111254 [Puniceibacterium sp. IMCC21224]